MRVMTSQEWLAQLVAFDTTSRYSNLVLIDCVESYLSDEGFATRRSYNEAGDKANLFATIPAKNGERQRGTILSGHTDVVPVAGQQWDTDPFSATTIKDRIYGRGTCDMKGFIAVVLSLIPELKPVLTKPLHLAFSYDEEVGCLGAPKLIADFKAEGIRPEACIVGEPTDMRPVVAHKGINVFRCQFNGYAVHSSLVSSGCNAIEYAAELISWIRNLAGLLKLGPHDKHYDVPFSSISTNQIRGGNALNTVPAQCEFFFELRNLPAVDPEKIIDQIKDYINHNLLPKMKSEYEHASIELSSIAAVPGHEASEESAITRLARSLTNNKDIFKVAYATEGGMFEAAGIPTVICGPGNIQQAHGPNEYVEISQLKQCEIFLRQLALQH